MRPSVAYKQAWRIVHDAHTQRRKVIAEHGKSRLGGHVVQITNADFNVLVEDIGEVSMPFIGTRVKYAREEAQ